MDNFKASHPNLDVKTRDLDLIPSPHLDGETIFAAWTPEDQRPETQKAKFAARLALINEVINAAHIVIATPMFNWSVPSVLKAWIDQLVLPGVLDSHDNAKLAGKSWTSIIATGASYNEQSHHKERDFESGYLELIGSVLGSKDVKVIQNLLTFFQLCF